MRRGHPFLRIAAFSAALAGSLASASPSVAQTCVPAPSGVISWWPGQGNGADIINGHDLTTGSATFAAAKVSQGFDLAAGSMTGPGAPFNMTAPGFTAEFWMKGVHNQPDALYLVLDKSHDLAGNDGWAFQGDSTTGELSFLSGDGAGFDSVATGDLLDGAWHHVAGTWDGSSLRLYVDGVLIGTAAHAAPLASTGALEVGDWHGASRRYVGSIDEITIYDRELTQTEIQAIVTADTAGKCSPCGNGTVDATEECDDGNNAAGDCCAADCTYEASGSACAADANACTDDECDGAGACTHPNNTDPCNDNLFCNGADTCAGGTCSSHAGDPCASGMECADECNEALDSCNDPAGTACTGDGNPCTDDECNGAGACGHPDNSAPCDDGLFCNGADTCDGGSCALHAGDPCAGAPDCADVCNEGLNTCNETAGTACNSDGNPCTDDECDGSGACGHSPNTDPCDDNLFCNGTDTCAGGTCSSHTGNPCTGGPVCTHTCQESIDACLDITGTACTDDGNVCTDDLCDGLGTCEHTPNSASCDDGIFCNGPDTCSGSACLLHDGDPCAGGGECADNCNEGAENCFEPAGLACTPDASACSDDECDGAGACAHPAANAGLPCRASAGECDLAESCNGTDPQCPADAKSTAQCRASTQQCDAAELCDGVNDECPVDVLAADGTPCNDAMVCTIQDECVAGVCAGNSMTCGDGNVQGSCNEVCDDGNLLNDDGCDDTCHFEPCAPTPDLSCRPPFIPGRSSLKISHADEPDRASLQWKWAVGTATTRSEFGMPLTLDGYFVCVYDNDALVSTTYIPPGGVCAGRACWKGKVSGFLYRDKDLTPDGAYSLKLGGGANGRAKIGFKGVGPSFDLPAPGSLQGPVTVQLVKASDAPPCWSATYLAPFDKSTPTDLSDKDN